VAILFELKNKNKQQNKKTLEFLTIKDDRMKSIHAFSNEVLSLLQEMSKTCVARIRRARTLLH